jgi:hypothetical protein
MTATAGGGGAVRAVTPVLLIRNVANKNWFAAGIQKFD